MSCTRTVPIPILPLQIVNAFLVTNGERTMLVDTGLPGSEEKIERVLLREGLTMKSIDLIVVTHAHVDHAGSAANLRARCDAPILAHEGDAPFYAREREMKFCTTDWASRLFLATNLIREPYEPFRPDILLRGTDAVDLAQFGFEGRIRPCAGHTPGSLCLELPSRDALVGDLVASGILIGGIAMRGRAKRPPFEDDAERVGRALLELVESGHERFHVGHGATLPAEEVRRHAHRLLSRSARLLPNAERSR